MDFGAIVSGGTKGVGLEITKHLVYKGFNVLALFKNDKENTKTLNIDRDKFLPFMCDITKKSDIAHLTEYLYKTKSAPFVLVNNAGFNDDALLWKMKDRQWNSVIDVTLKGAYNLSRLVIPLMRESNCGTIINISSVVAQIGVAGTTNYATAKAGLDGFTRSLSKELAPKRITVNTLALGYFDLGIIKTVPKNHLEQIIKNIPLNRLGTPTDLQIAINFLIYCRYVTGQTINVNGGLFG